MSRAIAPRTTGGKWAVGLGLAFVVLIVLKMLGAMPLPTFGIAALGLAGFVLALVARFKDKDRALLFFVPVFFGAVILVWIAGELLFPH